MPLCTCAREQHIYVGCDDLTPGVTPRDFDREDQEAWDASQAAWTYQAGF